MNEENSDAARLQEQHTAASSKDDKQSMATYVKQLLVEKQLLEEKTGIDFQLTNRLLANGESILPRAADFISSPSTYINREIAISCVIKMFSP